MPSIEIGLPLQSAEAASEKNALRTRVCTSRLTSVLIKRLDYERDSRVYQTGHKLSTDLPCAAVDGCVSHFIGSYPMLFPIARNTGRHRCWQSCSLSAHANTPSSASIPIPDNTAQSDFCKHPLSCHCQSSDHATNARNTPTDPNAYVNKQATGVD